jgi:hypothetical protein
MRNPSGPRGLQSSRERCLAAEGARSLVGDVIGVGILPSPSRAAYMAPEQASGESSPEPAAESSRSRVTEARSRVKHSGSHGSPVLPGGFSLWDMGTFV